MGGNQSTENKDVDNMRTAIVNKQFENVETLLQFGTHNGQPLYSSPWLYSASILKLYGPDRKKMVETITQFCNLFPYIVGNPDSNCNDETRLDVVRAAVEAGLNVNSKDFSGDTALHYAARIGDSRLVDYLLQAGAHKSAVNRNGDKPFDVATKNSHGTDFTDRLRI